MKKYYFAVAVWLSSFATTSFAQGTLNNGQLDDIAEFTTKYTVPLVMPDGIKLFTDFYVPRTRDSLVISLPAPLEGVVEVIPKGSQIMYYDSLNGQANPNPFQLPTVFTRTPYDKGDSTSYDALGSVFSIMGYNYMLQDMRGRYSSGGIYFPMYSDSWNKNGLHPNFCHVLDPYPLSDPRNSNKHEDGYNSVKQIAIIDSAYIAQYGDEKARSIFTQYYVGYPHTNTRLNNGSIGMIGASALGNTQLQLAAAHRIFDSVPQLKCLMPIVATIEHYVSTGYNNGVFRHRIVTGWLKGQIFTGTDDDLNAIDNDRDDSRHSSADYDLPKHYSVNRKERIAQQNKFEAANISIDHFSAMRYPWPAHVRPAGETDSLAPSGFYPNSPARGDMDASMAPVNEYGESVETLPDGTQRPLSNLTHSRYENMQVPVMHITGWWDIFIEGQIKTLQYTQKYTADTVKQLQKIVIGPWAHQTIASDSTGDRKYPANVFDITKVDISDQSIKDITNISLGKLITSDLLTWFRYNLNYNTDQKVGEPKFIIRAGSKWQPISSFGIQKQMRIPATDYVVPFAKMLNFLAGNGALENMSIAVRDDENDTTETISTIQAPISLGTGAGLGFDTVPESGIPYVDFHNTPTFRMYIPGPDAARDVAAGVYGNENVGNYWMTSEDFPPCTNVRDTFLYFHQNGDFDGNAPTSEEGYRVYVHDPDDPILTVGGSNMIVRSPDGTRNSQGQMDWSAPENRTYTMDREGVLKFFSPPVTDSFSIVGVPIVKLWAKTNPAGVLDGKPTDTDWMIRIGDQFPDGHIYFVTEGVVNARARNYAKSMVDWDESPEDIKIPYENINSGELLDYEFTMIPVGYSWGKGHRIVVLISSSSFTRYQVNPNLPLYPGEFFRRNPGDGQPYLYEGQEMAPRVAVQRVHFSPEHPTQIRFPLIDNTMGGVCVNPHYPTGVINPNEIPLTASLFPNPSSDLVHLFVSKPAKTQYEVTVTDAVGNVLETRKFDDNVILRIANYASGMYFATVRDLSNANAKVVKKFIKQ